MIQGKGIPFVDLITPHVELQEELLTAMKGVLTTGMFVGGPVVEEFERSFARFCDTKYCVGVASGTDALRFALMAAGIGKGDVVLTVPNTFVATVEAIVQVGAIPRFIDVDPQTYNMSTDALRTYLQSHSSEPIKALMPVHLYGQMCEMDEITALAEKYNLMVFEDACQAHGSRYFSKKLNRWQSAGSIGKAAAFSFYPGKNLGACGEGGAVTTNDEAIATQIRMIRDHGQNKKYHHMVEGYNGRLDALQAAILNVKLPFLKEWNTKRREAAKTYNRLLKDADRVGIPMEHDWSFGNYHLYVIRTPDRDGLQKHLTESKIGSGLHYPVPLHLQKACEYMGYKAGDFPITEKLSNEILSLPMFPQIQEVQLEQVAEALLQFSSVQTVG